MEHATKMAWPLEKNISVVVVPKASWTPGIGGTANFSANLRHMAACWAWLQRINKEGWLKSWPISGQIEGYLRDVYEKSTLNLKIGDGQPMSS